MIHTEILNEYKLIFSPNSLKNLKISPLGSGHIHQTFLVEDREGDKSYVFQKVNSYVFADIESLMQNILKVTSHLNKLYEKSDLCTLEYVKNSQGTYVSQDNEGNFWRVSVFIPQTITIDFVETLQQAYECGKAIGQFHQDLTPLEPLDFVEVIPNFHNIYSRISQLENALENTSNEKRSIAKPYVDFIMQRVKEWGTLYDLGKDQKIPLRVTHNDTKCNNILFNSQGESVGMIDLDTIMPGYVGYDFGDACRTLLYSLKEDDTDLENGKIHVEKFKYFTEGYLSTAQFLTENEKHSLLSGVFLLPGMQGARFLTDYLQGNVYYKTQYPNHNLDRAINQLKMVELLEEVKEEFENYLR